MRAGSILAILVFFIVAAAHLYRLVNEIAVTAGDWVVPQWASVVGIIVPMAIAFMLWKER